MKPYHKYLISGLLLICISWSQLFIDFDALNLGEPFQLLFGGSFGLLLVTGIACIFRAGQLDVADFHNIPEGQYPIAKELIPVNPDISKKRVS